MVYNYLPSVQSIDVVFMELAIKEADKARCRGEVPVGAVLVDGAGNVLAQDGNRSIEYHDPTAHAEILVLRAAGKRLGNYRLLGTTIYVTLESCVMCAAAMVHARIRRVVYGADDPKSGALGSVYNIGRDRRLNHQLLVDGEVMAEESAILLRDFFRLRRAAPGVDPDIIG